MTTPPTKTETHVAPILEKQKPKNPYFVTVRNLEAALQRTSDECLRKKMIVTMLAIYGGGALLLMNGWAHAHKILAHGPDSFSNLPMSVACSTLAIAVGVIVPYIFAFKKIEKKYDEHSSHLRALQQEFRERGWTHMTRKIQLGFGIAPSPTL